jgi:hypothetical protein
MPLKINVGLSRKVGQPNYGSRGASVNFEVEVEPTLVRQPQQLRDKIRYLFRLANEEVDQQLSSSQPPRSHEQGDGQAGGNGDSGSRHPRSQDGAATANQLRAIQAVAERAGVDLAGRLAEQFGVTRAEDLSARQASRLIEQLQSLEQPGGCP